MSKQDTCRREFYKNYPYLKHRLVELQKMFHRNKEDRYASLEFDPEEISEIQSLLKDTMARFDDCFDLAEQKRFRKGEDINKREPKKNVNIPPQDATHSAQEIMDIEATLNESDHLDTVIDI